MKKFTKIMSVLLALIIAVGMLPSVAYAASANNDTATTKVCKHINIEVYIKDNTCTKDGYKIVYCYDCRSITIEYIIYARGHHFVNGKCVLCIGKNEPLEYEVCKHTNMTKIETLPTCVDDGVFYLHCNDCKLTLMDAKLKSTDHDWTVTTCTAPRVCSYCNEIGSPDHDWKDATCVNPKTCAVCNITEGAANGHVWTNATCISPQRCKVCYVPNGSALGHSWVEATCTTPKTCSVCNRTEGDKLPHAYNKEKVDSKYLVSNATCTSQAVYYKSCVCGEKGTETFKYGNLKPHVYNQEKVDTKYLVKDDIYYKSCVCGAKGTETFNANDVKPIVFKDVPKDAYYYDAVVWAVRKNITTGTGDGTTFEPNAICNRAQVVTFLWRAAGSPEPKSVPAKSPFKDVKTTDYFYKAVLWAKENDITSGTGDGTTFEPNANCTRAQIVTFLCRAKEGKAPAINNPFTDVAENAYYYNPVLWAVDKNITTGTGDGSTFEPNANCTRGQVITFLYRAYN